MDNAWTSAFFGVVAAFAGAAATYFYNEFSLRPRLRVGVRSVSIARRPIRLPDAIYDLALMQGSFQEWLDEVVKWKVVQHFNDNSFTARELREVRSMLPYYVSRLDRGVEDARKLLEDVGAGASGSSGRFDLALSRLRHQWKSIFGTDVFVDYGHDPAGTTARMREFLTGDLSQFMHVREGCIIIQKYLDDGFSADAGPSTKIEAPLQSFENPRIPFILIELMIENTGKTPSLIHQDALLKMEGKRFHIRSTIQSAVPSVREVYSGEFHKVDPLKVEVVVWTQHPDRTSSEQMIELSRALREGATGTLELRDAWQRPHVVAVQLRDRYEG